MATVPPNDIGSADALETSQHFFVNQSGLLKQDTLASLITLIQSNILVPVANGGTGAATAEEALAALLPAQTGETGKVLGTDGIAASWVSATGGALLAASNLSDLADVDAAQASLGLGTAALLDAGNGADELLQLESEAGITGGVASPGALWITSGAADTEPAVKVDKAASGSTGNGIEVLVNEGLAAKFTSVTGNPFEIIAGGHTYLMTANLGCLFIYNGHTLTVDIPDLARNSTLVYPQVDGELVACEGGSLKVISGTGPPEGVVTAPVGSLYLDTAGVSGALWVKESGTGSSGWANK